MIQPVVVPGGFDIGPLYVSELELVVIARVGIAALLVVPLGIEREARARPAGLRTNILVGIGAALLTGVGELQVEHHANRPGVAADPTRIIHAIVIGIGFVGAGTIIVRHGEAGVSGLTTAANLLVVAAIGISVGLGLYAAAVTVTLLSLIVVGGLRSAEARLRRRSSGDESRGEDSTRAE